VQFFGSFYILPKSFMRNRSPVDADLQPHGSIARFLSVITLTHV